MDARRNETGCSLFTVEQEHDNLPGRPRYAIQEIGFSWTDIARLIGVSVRTIFNRRIAFDMPISDQELDRIVESIIHLNDRAGERLVAGELRHREHRIPYWRIRESRRSNTPSYQTTSRNSASPVVHRAQTVYGELVKNELRYSMNFCLLGGNHKLIDPWRIVIHGGIDGYSWLIVYSQASTNNRAHTVRVLFEEAVRDYGTPSRVRSNHGLENIDVARYMLVDRGTGRGSVLTGRSFHNAKGTE